MSEDFRRLPRTFEEDPKMFRWYTNEFKYSLRDKLDITEVIDIFTWEDISSHVRISYRFYQFVTTRYTTDFYIIIRNSAYGMVKLQAIRGKLKEEYTSLLTSSLYCLKAATRSSTDSLASGTSLSFCITCNEDYPSRNAVSWLWTSFKWQRTLS